MYSGHVRRIKIIVIFRNAVYQIKEPVYVSGNVKEAICITKPSV